MDRFQILKGLEYEDVYPIDWYWEVEKMPWKEIDLEVDWEEYDRKFGLRF